ncbi:arginase [Cladorrhinum samala]|uniref:Arginase n=1 Tax=Cladorrhinum samala TaxID=585594 RepID=A0AAV9I5H9_9PEZI|nr:arginase [Cladorrhinum samala]
MTTPHSITLIWSPYHVGLRDVGPGAGPNFLRSKGMLASIAELGLPVREIEVPGFEPNDFQGDIGRSFEVLRRTARLVAQEREAGSFPVVVAGNCTSTVGVAAGLYASGTVDSAQAGCVWFDAHDDFNTPDTVLSGYFDSMPISMLAGQCWRGLLATIPGFRPLSLDHVAHVGMRDVNEMERARVLEAGFDVVWGKGAPTPPPQKGSDSRVHHGDSDGVDFPGQLRGILEKKRLGPTMVHLDLDCLDVSLGKVNSFSCAGGLMERDLVACLETAASLTQPVSLTLASWDPSCDPEGAQNIAEIAIRAVKAFLSAMMSRGVLGRKIES